MYGKEATCQCRKCRFDPSFGKILWGMEWHPSPVFLPGESHGQRSLVGYSWWDCKRVRHNLATKQQQNRRKRSVNISLIRTGKQKNASDSHYFGIFLTAVSWSRTCSISKVCLCTVRRVWTFANDFMKSSPRSRWQIHESLPNASFCPSLFVGGGCCCCF